MPIIARSVLLGSFLSAAAVTAFTANGAFSNEGSPASVGPVLVRPSELGGGGVPASVEGTGAGVCGGFSLEGRYDDVPAAWSFRLCESAPDTYEVQVRFRNLSARPLRFQYRVWLTQPARCEAAADPSATLLLGGEKRLRPGQSEEWPFSTAEALRRDYRGRVWSCVMEVK
jgi:hypothetical protein